MRLRESGGEAANGAHASSLRMPAMLRVVLQAGIPRRSSGLIPIGSDARRKLEAYATLLRPPWLRL